MAGGIPLPLDSLDSQLNCEQAASKSSVKEDCVGERQSYLQELFFTISGNLSICAIRRGIELGGAIDPKTSMPTPTGWMHAKDISPIAARLLMVEFRRAVDIVNAC